MGIFVSWLVLTIIVWLTAAVVPGVRVRGIGGAVVVAALFGVLNAFIGWLLFGLFGIATFGVGFLLAFVTRWIVNAVLLEMIAAMTTRITILTFGRAIIAAIVMSLLGTLADLLLQGIY